MAAPEQQKTEPLKGSTEKKAYWCNFCDYSTDRLDDYLAHSCIEVLEAKGQKPEPTGQNECR